MSSRYLALSLLLILAPAGAGLADPGMGSPAGGTSAGSLVLAQAPMPRPPTVRQTAPVKKNCRREPIWGFRMSPFCEPTGICSDRVIKGYRTVCT